MCNCVVEGWQLYRFDSIWKIPALRVPGLHFHARFSWHGLPRLNNLPEISPRECSLHECSLHEFPLHEFPSAGQSR